MSVRVFISVCVIISTVAFACKSKEDDAPAPQQQNDGDDQDPDNGNNKTTLTACFTFPADPKINTDIAFSSSCSVLAKTYAWSFGDDFSANSSSTEQNTTHKYSWAGNYEVKLIVDLDGVQETSTQIVKVSGEKIETSCIPQSFIQAGLYPSRQSDSIAFTYLPDGKLSKVEYLHVTTPAPALQMTGDITYDDQGRMSRVDFIRIASGPYYSSIFKYHGDDELPFRSASFIPAEDPADVDTTGRNSFTYNGKGQLTQVEYRGITAPSSFQRSKFQYDDAGNTVKVDYSFGKDASGETNQYTGYENTSFDGSSVPYAGSKTLKFFLEYVSGVTPIVNNVLSKKVNASFQDPFYGSTYQGAVTPFTIEYHLRFNGDGLLDRIYDNDYNFIGDELRAYQINYTCQ